MHPIKSRVWDKTGQVMIYPTPLMNPLYLTLKGDLVEIDREGDEVPALNYEVLQFTGLLDKNDKEVWEGDIVEFVDMKGHWTTIRKEVKWSDEVAGFFPNFGDGYMEVIGNIYENAELIGD